MRILKKIMKWAGIVLGGLIIAVIVVHIILDIVFGAELRQTLRELKAQGVPLTIAEFAPPSVPDAENAAPLIKEAVEMIPARTNSAPSALKNLEDIVYANSSNKFASDITGWTEAQREEGAKLVQSEEVKAWYALLEKAARRPHFNNNLDWSQGPGMQLPNLGRYRALVRILAVKATFEGQDGNTNQALATILAGLKLSNKLSEEPTIITQLVRVACDLLLMEELERLAAAADIPAAQTRELIAELALHTDATPWSKSMAGERVGMGMWVYDRLMRASLHEACGVFGDEEPRIWAPIVVVFRPILKKDFVIYLNLMSEQQRRFELPYYQIACLLALYATIVFCNRKTGFEQGKTAAV